VVGVAVVAAATFALAATLDEGSVANVDDAVTLAGAAVAEAAEATAALVVASTCFLWTETGSRKWRLRKRANGRRMSPRLGWKNASERY
jgi:hypothetical protein